MTDQPRRKAAIVGIGATEFSTNSGRSEQRLAVEAILEALGDAGLSPDDIDGIINSDYEPTNHIDVVNAMGLRNIRAYATIPHGGGSPCGTIAQAAMMVASGECKCVLAYRSMNERSGHRYGSPEIPATFDGVYGLHAPYGLIVPGEWVAMHARRRMIEFGETREQWANIPLTFRKHANRNPRAIFHEKEMTLEDYLRAPMLADPLCRLDYCLETDGAVAYIVTSAERARTLGSIPAYIHATAQAMGYPIWYQSNYYRESLTTASEMVATAKILWKKSGLTPRDIDVAQIYDHFTPAVLTALEDMGFCEKGEAGEFVGEGRIGVDGDLPMNTAGGLLSEGYIHGWNLILEAVRQVRGTSTAQVKDVEFSLVTSCVGAPTSAAILSR
ncbi:MAG: lipid-transfer protein [Gammaproteobacteria bacterium]|nr:lipid-transfer protein [Gammaproteobacteria bacterium]MBP6051000.1 lipid-transfer protein [Pseudomonadales bacterium]MBK6582507.1 lipid-transfer protein [Gammaproteobacteria bacterium]MBK7169652.1 lipid-transfer protein [Gammaproteobacteria bacterium]MBK7521225.1 lipid-transfer protein [Gammaproteobacteria bacterium]